MSFPVAQLSVGTFLMAAAACSDVWRRKIPNVLNLLLGLAGLWAQASRGGPWAVAGGLGAGIAMVALLWLPWLKGQLGGGDVKAAAAGAVWLGFSGLPEYVLLTALMGGIVAAVCYLLSSLAARRQIRSNLTSAAVTLEVPAVPLRGQPGRVSVPYGLAVAMGYLTVLWTGGLW